MSEFSGYCPKCHYHEDVMANHPCLRCGAHMHVTHMDGKTNDDYRRKEE